MTRADRVVIRLPRRALVPPLFVALSSAAYASATHWAFGVLSPVGLLGMVVVLRTRTELAPSGVTTCDGLRVRRFPWSSFVSLAPRTGGTVAVTANGVRVPLPAVVWGKARRNTAAFVVRWAAEHGHVLTRAD
ncbi:MAG: hypothetical protein QOE45_712 [Frankiaceae bacterium]|jgi:hypothetical protein|nr:hypothetical protein [Frankiaceae bacterium]